MVRRDTKRKTKGEQKDMKTNKTKITALLLAALMLLSVVLSGCVAIRNEWESRFGDPSSQSDIETLDCEEFSEQMTVVLENWGPKERHFQYMNEYLLSKEDTKLLLDALKPNEIEFSFRKMLKLSMEKCYHVHLNDEQTLEVYGILDGSNSDGYVVASPSPHGGGYVDPSVVELLEEMIVRSELVSIVELNLTSGEEKQLFPEPEK